MKILFGTTIQSAEMLASLPEKAAETTPCLAVPVELLFEGKEVTTPCARFLAQGGEIFATAAVEEELAENLLTQSRAVKIAFVKEFRALCRQLAQAGIRELSAPFDVTLPWRKPALFAALRALLCELSGPLLENRLVCRLPLAFPQKIPAPRLAEFHRMLMPGAFGWLFCGAPDEEAAAWIEPFRFYADCWQFQTPCSREECTRFLTQAARCAQTPCRVYLPNKELLP